MLSVVALVVLVAGILLFRAGMKLVGAVIGFVGAVLVVAVVALAVFGDAFRIPSESMRDTLDVGDRVISIGLGSPGVGDVVVFSPPTGSRLDEQCDEPPPQGQVCAKATRYREPVTFVQRVVAVGGDELSVEGGRVIRDGKRAREPYAEACDDPAACDFPQPITIPRGHVFVMGDNRGASSDSRFWGPIPEDWVEGRVIGRYWPPGRAGTL